MTFPELIPAARLELRKYAVGDATRLQQLVDPERDRLLESFPELARGLLTPAEVDAFIADKAGQWQDRKTFCYGIWLTGADALIGQLQVKNVLWNIPSAELSYFIGREHLRSGFASEAIRAALGEAFDRQHFERIYLRIVTANHESLALARKLGFAYEGLHRREFRCGRSKIHDVHYFSLTSPDYRQIHAIVRS